MRIPFLNRLSDAGSIKHSLGALLAIGLAGLQFFSILSIVSSFYLTSEAALVRHARNMLYDASHDTIEHSRNFIRPADGSTNFVARLLTLEVVSPENVTAVEQLLFHQLMLVPQMAGAYYGDERGNFIMVMRSDDRTTLRTKIIRQSDDGSRSVRLIWRDTEFRMKRTEEDPDDTFDPRTRTWYQRAKESGGDARTQPYVFFSSQKPGITLSRVVLGRDGKLRGVAGVDIELDAISDFLENLTIGQTGTAMILYRNGDVIAHPHRSLISRAMEDGSLQLVNISDFGDPVAKAAFADFFRNGRMSPTPEKLTEFRYEGKRYVANLTLPISVKLPWVIAVFAPEDDFTGLLKRNRTISLWLSAGVAIVTGILGLIFFHYVYKPVRAFVVRSTLIAQGELDPAEPLPATYRELERANEALLREIVARRETEREYGQTFELSHRGMAQILPESSAFIRVNSRFCEIVGYTQEELLQMKLTDLLHPEERENWPLRDSRQLGSSLNHEMRWLRKDGKVIRISVNALLIRDHQGRPLHAVVTMDDITAMKEKEEELERLNRDLAHLARGNTVGEMASGLAHELNQPLAVIAQNADTALFLLNRSKKPDPELKQVLSEIEQQSLRAGGIIHALRSFIRKDEGERTDIDLRELMDQTLGLVRAELKEARTELVMALAPNLPKVRGNRVQIAQVLINLVRNAIEAMVAEPSVLRSVIIEAHRSGGHVLVTVSDTGPGISPNVSLFTQFETTKVTGMGLGLSICNSIIAAHGGQMWEDGAPGMGARFNFTLPIAMDAPPEQAEARDARV